MRRGEEKKEEGKAPPARPGSPVEEEQEPRWLARRAATLAFERHRGDALFTRSKLVEAVSLAMDAQGRAVSDDELSWACEVFDLPG